MKIIYQTAFVLFLLILSGNCYAYAKSPKAFSDDAKESSQRARFSSSFVAPSNRLAEKADSNAALTAARRLAKRASAQQGLLVIPAAPIAVAPDQPAVESGNTKGIINALCDVPLYILGCSFSANAAAITCDTNGDGVTDLQILLKDVRVVNRNLIRATIPALAPQLPGTAFPLACCGGTADFTVIQKVSAGDDNIFGDFTLKATCPIELGLRAPVIISASPSEGNCAIGQNLQIPGACFLLPDGKPNVTSVFAVEKGNPTNSIQAARFTILTANLIDALFQIGEANAGKTFLIYASGPNGTSRNLTALPQDAPTDCPIGNEQGIEVAFNCAKSKTPAEDPGPPPPSAVVNQCRLERTDVGVFMLTISGSHFQQNAFVTVSGILPKKLKFKNEDGITPGFFRTIVAKGRLCDNLPGVIVVHNPGEFASQPFFCTQTCATALTAQEISAPEAEKDLTPVPPAATVNGCRLERTETGVFILTIVGLRFKQNAVLTNGGRLPKKLKFKNPDPLEPGAFRIIIAKGHLCRGLPGILVVANPGELPSVPFFCNQACPAPMIDQF
jgi:hypothetical protein